MNGIYLLSLFLSQGSIFEATIYGLEPYSQYSLQVEAFNSAGRLIMNSYANEIGINYSSWAGDW